MTTQRKVVAVTGSSGHLGSMLLEHLEESSWVSKLVAFDTKPLRSPIHNIAAVRRDVSNPIHEELARHGAKALVHLAFLWEEGLRRRGAGELSERNAAMLRQVLESCRRAGVEHLVYVSSHSVYGARPDNPLPLHEGSPLRPSPGFPYAQDNCRAEEALAEFSEEGSGVKITILRSCTALGARTRMGLLRELYFPGWVGLSDHNPALQFVYDDDLARVISISITQELEGTFNVAGRNVAFLRELAQAISEKRTLLPAGLAYPLKRLTGDSSVAYSHFLDRWPIIMSTSRLQAATGYRFKHSALQAISALSTYNEENQLHPPKVGEIRRGAETPTPRIVTHNS